MVWNSMLYPSEYLEINKKQFNPIEKIMFTNPTPKNLVSNLKKDTTLNSINLKQNINIIDQINNYYSKNIYITGKQSVFILMINAIFHLCNSYKKQYFVFPNNKSAENFYFKLFDLINSLNIKKKIKLSHSGIKDLNILHSIKDYDIIIYSVGRFINNLSHKNINLYYNTTYLCDLDYYKSNNLDNVVEYLNSYTRYPHLTVVFHNSKENSDVIKFLKYNNKISIIRYFRFNNYNYRYHEI